jgi:hypothetical protein
MPALGSSARTTPSLPASSGSMGRGRLGDRLGDHRRRVVLVDEAERLGHEVLGDLLLDALDREAAPARVLGEHREILRVNSPGSLVSTSCIAFRFASVRQGLVCRSLVIRRPREPPIEPLHGAREHLGLERFVLPLLALDEGLVAGELVGASRRQTAPGTVQRHRVCDERLEVAAIATDEAVDVLGRILGRQRGSPARQQLVEDRGSGHRGP